jgi:hypothetical protein
VISIGIPRPRDLQMESSKEFMELRMKIWNIIRSEVEKSMRLDHDNS